MDKLFIEKLLVNTKIGVHAWEQQILQRLLLDITIPIDCTRCNDNIENTLDYDKLCQRITDYIETRSFRLIETVANDVAQFIKDEFNVQIVTLRVSKPYAIKNASDVCVTITR